MAKEFTGSMFKTKSKKKPKPKTNKRITEYIPCERCGGIGTQTHEIFFGNPNRQKSIEMGFQEVLCKQCHDKVHSDVIFRRLMQSECQEKTMHARGWTIQDWRDNTGIKNYL